MITAKRIKQLFLVPILAVGTASFAWADYQEPNKMIERCSSNNQFFFTSTPTSDYGDSGKTVVYKNGDKTGILYSLATYYDFIISDDGHYLIMNGAWHGGFLAQKDHSAVAFYRDGILLKGYSTLDIVEDKDNIDNTTTGYFFARNSKFDGKYYSLERIDGGWIKFDVATGSIVSKDPLSEDAIKKITQWRYEREEAEKAYEKEKLSGDKLSPGLVLLVLLLACYLIVRRLRNAKKQSSH